MDFSRPFLTNGCSLIAAVTTGPSIAIVHGDLSSYSACNQWSNQNRSRLSSDLQWRQTSPPSCNLDINLDCTRLLSTHHTTPRSRRSLVMGEAAVEADGAGTGNAA